MVKLSTIIVLVILLIALITFKRNWKVFWDIKKNYYPDKSFITTSNYTIKMKRIKDMLFFTNSFPKSQVYSQTLTLNRMLFFVTFALFMLLVYTMENNI